MSMKKKLGSKLAHGVRQVKSQRELEPAAAPAQTALAAKPAAQPTSAKVTAKPVVARAAPVTHLGSLHPRRVWPD